MKKKFLTDILLNLFASAMPLLILQVFAMPIIARFESSEDYGIIIVLISILTLISVPMGNVLNNIRLLKEDNYKCYSIVGDFQPILLGSSLFALTIYIFSIYYFDLPIDFTNLFLQILILICLLLREYWIVDYRIKLNFLGMFYNNFFLSLGYLIGLGIYYFYGYWEVIYFAGLFLSNIYILLSTNIWCEPFRLTYKFSSTLKEYILLYSSGFIKNLINYSDKILLLPLLGPTSVAIYFSATIVGKITSVLFAPINSVILSYLINRKEVTNHQLWKGLSLAGFILFIGYTITILLSPILLKTLYPEWSDSSLEIITITTAGIFVAILGTLFQPFNLKYNKIKWQLIMNSSSLILFAILAVTLTPHYGLTGYSFSYLLNNIYSFIFQIVIFLKRSNN